MNYFTLPGVLGLILLAGCQAPAPAPVSADRYGAASAVGITRHAQYQMWNNGVWSGTTPDDGHHPEQQRRRLLRLGR